jgi:large subunit ribosomal protein L15
MKLNNLKPAEGAVKRNTKRIGRGQGSGKGGTSTRGHKGAKSRSGYSRKVGFEGGQMPLQRRVPKYGFTNINRKEYKVFNLQDLEYLSEKYKVDTIDVNFLYEKRLIRKKDLVKILGSGELTKKVNILVHAVSKTAKEAIEKQQGTVNIL